MSFQTKSLVQQGYSALSEKEINSLKWGLRFTPTVCMLAAVFGIVTLNAPLLLSLAVLGIVPFWFPAWHPVDRLYNHVVAPLVGARRLPPNPFPRRIACVSAGVLNTTAALFILNGANVAAYVTGGVLFTLQLIVNTTHFCLASFLIELGLMMVGKSLPSELIDGVAAQKIVEEGALLIDVRDASEFEAGHLPNAVNIPLGDISAEAAKLRERGQPIVLYCENGGRAKIAHGILARSGICGIRNLGGYNRWPGHISSASSTRPE